MQRAWLGEGKLLLLLPALAQCPRWGPAGAREVSHQGRPRLLPSALGLLRSGAWPVTRCRRDWEGRFTAPSKPPTQKRAGVLLAEARP